MAEYLDANTGKWNTQFYYKTITGDNKKKHKRGFERKKDAKAWREEFIRKNNGTPDMDFFSLWDEYKEDLRHEIKESTWETKIAIVDKKILPFFGKTPIMNIDERMIKKWQSWILGMTNKNGDPYSETYIRNINNQLSAILNHGVLYYKLPHNPIHRVGSIGAKHAKLRDFWTLEEFKKAIIYFKDSIDYKTAFSLLFFSGIREGELLSLTLNDFDLENHTVDIKTNWGRRKKRNATTTTKTRSSNRIVTLPEFLIDDILVYSKSLYHYEPNQRLFSHLNKYYLNSRLKKAAMATGVKKITVHELRHSHASLLINNEVNIKALKDRLGHKNIETTLDTYSHMYNTKQKEIAKFLNNLEPK